MNRNLDACRWGPEDPDGMYNDTTESLPNLASR